MLKIENVEIIGWEHAIRGMRNPKNSWERSDSYIPDCKGDCERCDDNDCKSQPEVNGSFVMGCNDLDLASRLSNAGPVHRKFMRMITVYLDITAPLYWWKEFDTYKVGSVANSCSTMHKIADKEFTLEDFSHEHLMPEAIPGAQALLDFMNVCREGYLKTKDKKYWWQMIQLLPSSYNQKRTVMLNYEVLANIYEYRRDHKLDEWLEMCNWIKTLPYSELITGEV